MKKQKENAVKSFMKGILIYLEMEKEKEHMGDDFLSYSSIYDCIECDISYN